MQRKMRGEVFQSERFNREFRRHARI
jgi:hypothetical protein